jgi:hypothetical protein
MDKRLADAGYQLAEEIRDGVWKHVSDLRQKPAPACTELIEEFQHRCPGFSLPEYQRALAEGLQNSR